jgi:hypothetical protein
MKLTGLLTLAAVAAVAGSGGAQAYRGSGSGGGYVHAESRYGHGSVAGPVRVGPRGRYEVRLPGGTWIECARSCGDTLRRETVDFWESRGGRNDPPDGPAYISRWLMRRY